MAWIYIIIAAIIEAAWTYSLKFFKLSNLKLITWSNFYTPEGLLLLAPITGYLVFGLGNAWFFSLAIKQIPTAVAFAAWTGASIIALKLGDMLFFKESITWGEVFFTLMIIGGVVGLKLCRVDAVT